MFTWIVYKKFIVYLECWNVYLKCLLEMFTLMFTINVYLKYVFKMFTWHVYLKCLLEMFIWNDYLKSLLEVFSTNFYVKCLLELFIRNLLFTWNVEMFTWNVYLKCLQKTLPYWSLNVWVCVDDFIKFRNNPQYINLHPGTNQTSKKNPIIILKSNIF